MVRQRLDEQADRIEWVLATHKAPARVTGGRVTARTIQFRLHLAPTTSVRKVQSLGEEVALALGASDARIERDNGMVYIEVARSDAQPLRLLELEPQIRRNASFLSAMQRTGTALVGMTAEGVPLLIRLGTPEVPHVLIAGTTGSGKSQAARTLVASMALFQPARNVQLLIIDPKGSDFGAFAALPHMVSPPVVRMEDARERLDWLVDEMTRRQQERVRRPRIIVLIDELADLLMQGGTEMENLLARLVQRGRSAGICIVGCTQKPTAGVLGTLVKANFPVRLVGKVTSAQEALVAAGISRSGAEKLAGRGDFLLIANGDTTRVQIAHFPHADEASWLRRAAGEM